MMHYNTQSNFNGHNAFVPQAPYHCLQKQLNDERISNHHFDEADALLFGLEKSIMADHSPKTEWTDSHPLADEANIFEPYPMVRPQNWEQRSSDLRLFLDHAIAPTQKLLEPLTLLREPLIKDPESFPEERKRSLEQSSVAPASKRSRTCEHLKTIISDDEESADESHESEGPLPKFREYQEQQWQEQYSALLEYKAKHGHCCVPNTYKPNPTLGRWVKRQRYQYKLRQAGEQSTLVASRVEALERVGFIWDSHAALWEQRLNELKEYRLANGDCNVPSTYPKNPQLSTWVKCQRRQYKLEIKGKSSNLTEERIATLDDLGFVWDGRTIGNKSKKRFVEKAPLRTSTRFSRSPRRLSGSLCAV